MRIEALSDAVLLDIWERGHAMHPLDQGLALLAAGCPDCSWETLAGLSIGRRDDLLLRLRAATLGPWLNGQGQCPGCTETVEFQVRIPELFTLQPDQRAVPRWTLDFGTLRLEGRLPDSTDLAAIASCEDPLQARRLLARRCISRARCGQTPWDAEAMSEEIIAALSAEIGKADPLADIELQLHCPTCDHQWQVSFDIVSFFWSEIGARVDRLLRDIHLLARAYGWGESEILALAPRRRQRYIDMVVQWTC
jgi:hypothetical protein